MAGRDEMARWQALGLVSLCCLQVGCDVEGFGGIGTAALDPAKSFYDLPPTQVMTGQFRRVRVVGVDNDSVYLLALTTGEESHLLITDYRADTTCDAGQVEEYSRLTGVEYPLVLEVSAPPDELGYRDVRFIDGHCQEVMPALADTLEFPGWWVAERESQYDYWQRDGTLVVIDPYAKQEVLRVHAERYYRGSGLTTVEDGNLTFRERESLDEPTVVSGVSDFGSWHGGYAHQTADGVVLLQGFDLTSAPVEYDVLVPDACLVARDDGPTAGRVGNLLEVPCGSGQRQLIVGPGVRPGESFALVDVPADFGVIREVEVNSNLVRVYIETGEFDGFQLFEARELVTESVEDWPPEPPHDWELVGQDLPATSQSLTDLDENGGRLFEWRASEWYPVADNVFGSLFYSYCESGFLVLSRPPDTTGRLGCGGSDGVAYFKANTNTLAAFPLELGEEQIIARDVSQFRVTDYPVEGIVYIIESGDDAGVWFARGR